MNQIHCKLKYECPKNWFSLKDINQEKIRFCDHCKEKVFKVDTEKEFQQKAKEGSCVFISFQEPPTAGIPQPLKD